MRIAVAMHPEVDVNAHFGYAQYFLIFDVDTDVPRLVETRQAATHCTGSGGDRRLLRASVAAVTDCVAVVATQIGPCARRALDDAGVLAVEHEGPGLEGASPLVNALKRSRLVSARRKERLS